MTEGDSFVPAEREVFSKTVPEGPRSMNAGNDSPLPAEGEILPISVAHASRCMDDGNNCSLMDWLSDDLVHHCISFCDNSTLLHSCRLVSRRFKTLVHPVMADRTRQSLPLQVAESPKHEAHEVIAKIHVRLVSCPLDNRALVKNAIQEFQEWHPLSTFALALQNDSDSTSLDPKTRSFPEIENNDDEDSVGLSGEVLRREDMEESLCTKGSYHTMFLQANPANYNINDDGSDDSELNDCNDVTAMVSLRISTLLPSFSFSLPWIHEQFDRAKTEMNIPFTFRAETSSTILRFLSQYVLFVATDPAKNSAESQELGEQDDASPNTTGKTTTRNSSSSSKSRCDLSSIFKSNDEARVAFFRHETFCFDVPFSTWLVRSMMFSLLPPVNTRRETTTHQPQWIEVVETHNLIRHPRG